MDNKLKDWIGHFAPRFYAISLAIGAIIRFTLLLLPITVVDFTFTQYLRIFFLGALNDLAFASIGLVPAFLFYCTLTDKKYEKPLGYIIEGLLALLTFYVVFFNDITDEYAGVVPAIANSLLIIILLCFSLKLFLPKVREKWRLGAVYTVVFLYGVFNVLFVLIGEPVFWFEFGVRYNFIAVDYLIYTNEIIGNIVESYPMVPLVIGVLVLSSLYTWVIMRGYPTRKACVLGWKRFVTTLAIFSVVLFGSLKWLHWGYQNLTTSNVFLTELPKNGCWNFLEAFVNNELNFSQFYTMIEEEEAEGMKNKLCHQDSTGVNHIVSQGTPVRKNIVLITVESLSANFMEAYGDNGKITPNLDALVNESLVFDNLFATGNRTVRGLEAVTLSLPPSSGESLVKRNTEKDFFSTGGVLREMGYHTFYVYGGDGYFDNMEAFFSKNGYEVHDKKTYKQDEIVFANIWGTSDEDSYREAISLFDADYSKGVPFFAHVMTISNHRPFTYPEGRIEVEGDPMSRRAAVKYSDYAIGQFIEQAKQKPWFKETVFVIVADHCASSAGKTSLPLECYHIPAMIYAPGFVEPQRVGKVCSQIDLMPTLFDMLHFSYDSKFYGQNILSDSFRERAFMATYQDLGYYADGILTILSPVKVFKQYKVTQHDGWNYQEDLMEDVSAQQLSEAQALYQVANVTYAGK